MSRSSSATPRNAKGHHPQGGSAAAIRNPVPRQARGVRNLCMSPVMIARAAPRPKRAAQGADQAEVGDDAGRPSPWGGRRRGWPCGPGLVDDVHGVGRDDLGAGRVGPRGAVVHGEDERVAGGEPVEVVERPAVRDAVAGHHHVAELPAGAGHGWAATMAVRVTPSCSCSDTPMVGSASVPCTTRRGCRRRGRPERPGGWGSAWARWEALGGGEGVEVEGGVGTAVVTGTGWSASRMGPSCVPAVPGVQGDAGRSERRHQEGPDRPDRGAAAAWEVMGSGLRGGCGLTTPMQAGMPTPCFQAPVTARRGDTWPRLPPASATAAR